jgi:hypothetical protein
MTAHDPYLGDRHTRPLRQLDDLQGNVVLYLRLWCDGPAGRAAVRDDLIAGLGQARADGAIDALHALVGLLVQYRCRPLVRHDVQCARVTPDETQFATFIATAASADRESALWIAMQLVRHDKAPDLTAAATDFGLLIKQMLLQCGHADRVLH